MTARRWITVLAFVPVSAIGVTSTPTSIGDRAEIAALQQRIVTLTTRRAELVHRLAALEAEPPDVMVLRAPLDIQDSAGKTIAMVTGAEGGRGVDIANEQQSVRAFVGQSMVSVWGSSGAVQLRYRRDGPSLTMDLAKPIAYIGPDGFAAFTPQGGQATTQLSATVAQAGYLNIGNAVGEGMVEAGMLSIRPNVGVVRVSPYTPRMELLLPITPHRIPNFIMGYKPKR
jgi:hypothetical protein